MGLSFTATDITTLKAIRDILYQATPALSVYVGSLETATTVDTTHVTVANTIRKVASVWLSTDTTFTGTNYYADSGLDNWTSKTILLDSALPSISSVAKVAYYSDCAVCGWDAIGKTGRDPLCTTCGGTGMTLSSGTAISVPIKRLKAGKLTETTQVLGEQLSGIISFRAKIEYENLLRAGIKIEYIGRVLEPLESGKPFITDWKWNLAGQKEEVECLLRFKEYS